MHGPVRPDVDPELASMDPVAAGEWFGYVPDARMGAPSALAAALRQRSAAQLAEIVEAVASDPRWGWLTIQSGLLMTLTGGPQEDRLRRQVEEWLRLRGVRIVDAAKRAGRK